MSRYPIDPFSRTVATTPPVIVLGLDSVSPALLFERFRSVMPNVRHLMENGAYGPLRSCDPPITVPAWAVMFTGVDPGTLGLYGFRNRKPGSYFDQITPTPQALQSPPIWDLLSRQGRRVCVIGVPPGYPPPRVNGVSVSDLLTPPDATDFAWPASERTTIEALVGRYLFDLDVRSERREVLADELFEMTRRRWTVARHYLRRERWDLFVLHEIGPDRLHHGFWKYFDPDHPRHEAHPIFSGLAERYYRFLDEQIGELLRAAPADSTIVLASDHGSQAMRGCFCINEWLRERGYLVLREAPKAAGTPLEELPVDWDRTVAWGAGGYYARIQFNVRGREPHGIVDPAELDGWRERIAAELQGIHLSDGRPLNADARWPERLYRSAQGAPPDLMVYFDGLKVRSAGTMGHGRLFLSENDTGPDDAVHDWDGVLLASGPGIRPRGELPRQMIQDVAPTILGWLGASIPPGMQGRPIGPLAATGP